MLLRRCDASFYRSMTDGHLSPLGCAKFYLNRRRGVGMRPQNIKNFHFLVKSRLAWANPSTAF